MIYNINKVVLEGVLITDAKQTSKAVMFILKSQKGLHTNFFSIVWLKATTSTKFLKTLTKGTTVIISGTISTEEGKVVVFADDIQKRYTQFVKGEKKQIVDITPATENTEVIITEKEPELSPALESTKVSTTEGEE